jgi:hypothetical protein
MVAGSSSPSAPAAGSPTTTPAPTATVIIAAPSPSADPGTIAPVDEPTFAPDGRTGDPALDELIERLLGVRTIDVGPEHPDTLAHEQICDPGCREVPVPEWASRLAAAERSLYSVYTAPVGGNADVHILLTVDTGGRIAEVWRVRVAGGRPVAVEIFPAGPDPGTVLEPAFYFLATAHAPSPASQYELFYVLPPPDALPKAPPVHPITTRTGIAGVDALLTALESRDPSVIQARLADPAAPLVRQCEWEETKEDTTFAARWSQELRDQLHGVHSVSRIPDGYQPRADHLVILYRQLKPYWWAATGILERGGRIVGLFTDDQGCRPEAMYPPDRYVVPPPEGGISGLDPSRRSGIAIVDAVLDAVQERDLQALAALIDYTRAACGDEPDAPPGAGPPPCPSGAPSGTLVNILPEVVCHGGFATEDQAPAAVIGFVAHDVPFGLYAVVEGHDERGTAGSVWRVVTASGRTPAALTVTERGVSRLDMSCGPSYPEYLMSGGSPSFVLPPP